MYGGKKMEKALVFLMTAVMALNVCACGGKAETAKQETAEEKTERTKKTD